MVSALGLCNRLRFRDHASAISVLLLVLSLSKTAAAQSKTDLIRDALSAAPPEVAGTARVVNWDGTVLKEGSGAFTCYPTPGQTWKRGREPMCLDKTWTAWAEAWANKKLTNATEAVPGIDSTAKAAVGSEVPHPLRCCDVCMLPLVSTIRMIRRGPESGLSNLTAGVAPSTLICKSLERMSCLILDWLSTRLSHRLPG